MSLNLNTTSGDTYSGWDVGQVLLRLSNTAETLQDNADGWLRLANDTERCITGLLTDILAENERSKNWKSLSELLQKLPEHPAILDKLINSKALKHYVPRAVRNAVVPASELQQLADVFPQLVSPTDAHVGEPVIGAAPQSSRDAVHHPQTSSPVHISQLGEQQRQDICHQRASDAFEKDMKQVEKLRKVTSRAPVLTWKDFQQTMPVVVQENATVGMSTARQEEVLEQFRAHAAERLEQKRTENTGPASVRSEAEEMEEILHLMSMPAVKVPTSNKVAGESRPPPKPVKKQAKEAPPMTGMELARDFLSGKLDNSVKLAYLRLTPSHLYRPYDLHVVQQEKAGDDFYIMSRYSIVYCSSLGKSDTDTLKDWYWEAMMFEVATALPFFKQFLVRKMFARWRLTYRQGVFQRRCKAFQDLALQSSPTLLGVLQGITRKILGLEKVDSIAKHPQEDLPLNLAQVTQHATNSITTVSSTMHAFFKDGRSLLDAMVHGLKKRIEVLQEQRADQPYFSYKPNADVRELKQHCQLEVDEARAALENFQRLVHVVDQMVLTELLSQGRRFASLYVDTVQSQLTAAEHGHALLKAQFLVSATGEVSLSPPMSEVKNTLLSIFNAMLTSLTHQASSQNVFSAAAYSIATGGGAGAGAGRAKSVDVKTSSNDVGTTHSPSARSNSLLVEHLVKDSLFAKEKQRLAAILTDASSEITTFLTDQKWFKQVFESATRWNSDTFAELMRGDASHILTLLGQVKEWLAYLTVLPDRLMTGNNLLDVDCSALTTSVLPQVKRMQIEISHGLTAAIGFLSSDLASRLDQLSEPLLDKSSYVEGFAKFATDVIHARKKKMELQASKTRFEAFLEAYEQALTEEMLAANVVLQNAEKLNDDVQNAWRLYMTHLYDAESFVRAQGPRTERSLYVTISCLKEEGQALIQTVNAGQFVDPKAHHTRVQANGRKVYTQFKSWQDQYNDTAKWMKSVSGKQHDLSLVQEVYDAIIARTDLWQLIGRSTCTVDEWKATEVRNVNIQGIGDLLEKWIKASTVLEDHLPEGDPVLAEWKENMQHWVEIMNAIQVVFAPFFKPRHWKSLYSHLNKSYNMAHHYTLNDVVSLGLLQHRSVLASVVTRAQNEYDIQLTLEKLQQYWQNKEFQFVPHTLKRLPLATGEEEQSAASSDPVGDKSTLTIVPGISDLIETLEDHTVLLHSILQSQYILDLKPQAEWWLCTLRQLKELIELWASVQKNWQYIGQILHDSRTAEHLDLLRYAEPAGQLHVELLDLSSKLKQASNVLCLVGQAGSTDTVLGKLSGEPLRLYLLDILQRQDNLMKCLDTFLEKVRSQFPRLYFVEKSTVFNILLHSQHPPSLLSDVKLCFPELKEIRFEDVQPCPELTAAMKVQGLPWRAVSVCNLTGETLTLHPPVLTSGVVQSWLNALDLAIHHSLAVEIHHCLSCLLAINAEHKSETQWSADNWMQWLCRWPVQALLISLMVHRTSSIQHALESSEKDTLSIALHKYKTCWKADQQVLCHLMTTTDFSVAVQTRLKLSAVVQQILFYMDILNDLLLQDCRGPHDFSWLQHLHYTADPVPDAGDSPDDPLPQLQGKFPSARSTTPCSISATHLGSRYAYGYEYYSGDCVLPQTLLTSSTMITVLHALSGRHTPLLYGHKQSGKSSTIKQLAKTLARLLVMLDCSQSVPLQVISQYICGAVQAGAFLCFEHAHCLLNNKLIVLSDWLTDIAHSIQHLMIKTSVTSSSTCTKSDNVHLEVEDEVSGLEDELIKVLAHDLRQVHFTYLLVYEAITYTLKNPIASTDMTSTFATCAAPEECSAGLVPACHAYTHGSLSSAGNVMHAGHTLNARDGYGTIMIWSGPYHYHRMPTSVQVATRPINVQLPSELTLATVQLCSAGFVECQQLACWLVGILKTFRTQLDKSQRAVLSPSHLQHIVQYAAAKRLVAEELRQADAQTDVDKDPQRTLLMIEKSLVQAALQTCLRPVFSGQQLATLNDLLSSDTATSSSEYGSTEYSYHVTKEMECRAVLSLEIQICLDDNRLQTCSGRFVEKTLELYDLLRTHASVIVLGSAGSGKSRIIQVLEQSLNAYLSKNADTSNPLLGQASRMSRRSRHSRLNSHMAQSRLGSSALSRLAVGTDHENTISTTTLFPRANSEQQIFGSTLDDTPSQLGHLKSLLLTYANSKEHRKQRRKPGSDRQKTATDQTVAGTGKHWIVLDGPVDSQLVDSLATAVDMWKSFSGATPRNVPVNDDVRFLMECDSVEVLSPAMISQCAILNVPDVILLWPAVLETWLIQIASEFSLPVESTDYISTRLKTLIPKSLGIVHRLGAATPAYLHSTVSKDRLDCLLVTQVLAVFHAVMRHHLCEDDQHTSHTDKTSNGSDNHHSADSSEELDSTASIQERLLHMAVYSLIWGLAGSVADKQQQSFDAMMEAAIRHGSPLSINIPSSGSLMNCHLNKTGNRFLLLAGSGIDVVSSAPATYTALPEVLRYSVLINYLVSDNQSVLLTGHRGVGKTSLMKYAVSNQHAHFRHPMSANVSRTDLQQVLEERHGHMASPLSSKLATLSSRRYVVFLDDIHLSQAAHPQYSCNELLRQVLSTGHVYEPDRYIPSQLSGLVLVASLNSLFLPKTSPRFLRQWFTVNVASLPDTGVRCTVSPWIMSWLEEFPAYSVGNLAAVSESLIQATLRVHRKVQQTILPDPTQPHCLFDQRHIFQVLSGLQLVSPSTRPRHFQRRKQAAAPAPGGVWKSDRQAAPSKANTGKSTHGPGARRRAAATGAGAGMAGSISEDASAASPGTSNVTPPMLRTLVRLWCHEVTCTYMDALNTPEKISWFSSMLTDTVHVLFCGASDTDTAAATTSAARTHASTVQNSRASDTASHLSTDSASLPPLSRRANRAVSRRAPGSELNRTALASSQSKRNAASSRKSSRKGSSTGAASSRKKSKKEGGGADGAASEEVDEFEAALLEAARLAESSTQGGLVCVPIDSLMRRGEDLTTLVFTKHLVPGEEFCRLANNASATPGTKPKSAYVECGSGELEQASTYVLQAYNSQQEQPGMELVLFPRFVDHLAKQCRLLAFSGHHSVLIGPHGYGRRTVLKMAACACCRKIIELKAPRSPPGLSEAEITNAQMRYMFSYLHTVIEAAGVERTKLMLLVTGKWSLKAWSSLATFMAEGICPGVYSAGDLTDAALRRTPSLKKAMVGTNQAHQTNLADKGVSDLLQCVKDNTHVAIHLTDNRRDLCQLAVELPQLFCGNVTVNWYSAWSESDCMQATTHVLEQNVNPGIDFDNAPRYSTHSIGNLLASIHHQMRHQLQGKPFLSSSLTAPLLLDAPRVFGSILRALLKKNMEHAADLKTAIQRIESAQQATDNHRIKYEQQVAAHDKSARELKKMEGAIAKMKRTYYESLDHCQEEESEIDARIGPLERMMEEVREEQQKIVPLYEEAVKGLECISAAAITEIKSYHHPPEALLLVSDAVCVLFDKQPSWENAKQLFLSRGFMNELVNFDKENVSNAKLRQIRQYIRNPGFDDGIIGWASHAFIGVCIWLKALIRYTEVNNKSKPLKERLYKLEQKMKKAKEQLDEKRKRAGVLRKEINKKMEVYGECAAQTKELEKPIVSMETQVQTNSALVSSLQKDYEAWCKEGMETSKLLDSAAGDALLGAAAVCYGSLIPVDRMEKLLDSWRAMCQSAGVTVRENFSLPAILGSSEQQFSWFSYDVPRHSQAVSCIYRLQCASRSLCHHWPILVDPDDQGVDWLLKAEMASYGGDASEFDSAPDCLQKYDRLPIPFGVQYKLGGDDSARMFKVVQAASPDLVAQVVNAAQNGHMIVIDHLECAGDFASVHQLFQRQYLTKDDVRYLSISGELVKCHASFTLVGRMLCSTVTFPASALTTAGAGIGKNDPLAGCFVDVSLTKKSTCAFMTQEILREQAPYHRIRVQHLDGKIYSARKETEVAREGFLKYLRTVEGGPNLLENENILLAQQQCALALENCQAQLQHLIMTQASELQKFSMYDDIGRHAAMIYNGVQHFVKYYPRFHLPMATFEQWLLDAVHALHRQFSESLLTVDAHVSYVLDSLTQDLKDRCMQLVPGRQRQVLLLFLVMPLKRELSSTSEAEWSTFISDMENEHANVPSDRPPWINYQTWKRCATLQSTHCFANLCSELSGAESGTWMEYYQARPSLIDLPSVGNTQLSAFQVVLLWKALKPELVYGLLQELIDMHMCNTSSSSSSNTSIQDNSDGCRSSSTGFIQCTARTPTQPVLLSLPYPEDCSGAFSVVNELHKAAAASAAIATSNRASHTPRVLVFSLTSADQQARSLAAVSSAAEQGDWIVYTDSWCSSSTWTEGVLQLLAVLVAYASQSNLQSVLQMEKSDLRTVFHPLFRVIVPVLNQQSISEAIPTFLLSHSMKTSLDLRDDLNLVQADNYQATKAALLKDDVAGLHGIPTNSIAQYVAMLHSVMQWTSMCAPRMLAGPYLWNSAHLQDAVSLVLSALQCDGLLTKSPDFRTITQILVSFVYSQSVKVDRDQRSVKALAELCCKLWSEEVEIVADFGTMTVKAVEGSISSSSARGAGLHNKLASLQHMDFSLFQECRSRLLLKELQGLTSPTSLTAAGALNDHQVGSVLQRVEWVINYLQSMLKLAQRAALAKDNKIGTGTQLPFWLDTESLLYETNIAALLNDDSKRLQAVLKGHECWNSTTDDVFLSVLSGKVPAAWEKRFPQLHAHAHSILSWIDALSDLTKELEMHLARAATPRDPVKVYTSSERPIRLGLLFHPNAFLKCIMTTAAETSSKTLRDLYWAIELPSASRVAHASKPVVQLTATNLTALGLGDGLTINPETLGSTSGQMQHSSGTVRLTLLVQSDASDDCDSLEQKNMCGQQYPSVDVLRTTWDCSTGTALTESILSAALKLDDQQQQQAGMSSLQVYAQCACFMAH